MTSDIDLLAISEQDDSRFDTHVYSVYSYLRLRELWNSGNPFAWHLSLESSLIYAQNGVDFIKELGPPAIYRDCYDDCVRFSTLFEEARSSLEKGRSTKIFDLSTAFLGVRNFASCFSLGMLDSPNFSRNSARRIGSYSINIPDEDFNVLERARILSTRGIGSRISDDEVGNAILILPRISGWMRELTGLVKK